MAKQLTFEDFGVEIPAIYAIPGYEGRYGISVKGEVYSYLSHKFLKTPVGKRGYENVNLIDSNGVTHLKCVHRLVALTFIPNPDNLPQINHIDGDKTNNHVCNLEWCSAAHNLKHARETGLHMSDGDKAVIQIKDGKVVARFKSASEASRATGIKRSSISNVCRGYVWNGHHCRTAGGFEWKYE